MLCFFFFAIWLFLLFHRNLPTVIVFHMNNVSYTCVRACVCAEEKDEILLQNERDEEKQLKCFPYVSHGSDHLNISLGTLYDIIFLVVAHFMLLFLNCQRSQPKAKSFNCKRVH